MSSAMNGAVMATGNDSQLALIFQYTVEAYKTFQKLAESLPNPMSANVFAAMARDEREFRDLLEIKYLDAAQRMKITLGSDLRFQDMLEGDLSYREIAEMLIARERTMERKLAESLKSSSETDRNLYRYLATGKRSHVVLLERELEMIRAYPDWFRREDAEDLIVHGRSR
jgi:rubrerythrin